MDVVSFSDMPLNSSWFQQKLLAFRKLRTVGTYVLRALGLPTVPPSISTGLAITEVFSLAENNINQLHDLVNEFESYNLDNLDTLDLRGNPLCEIPANSTSTLHDWTKVYYGSKALAIFVSDLQQRSVAGVFRRTDSECNRVSVRSRLFTIIVSVGIAIPMCVILLIALVALRIIHKRVSLSNQNQHVRF